MILNAKIGARLQEYYDKYDDSLDNLSRMTDIPVKNLDNWTFGIGSISVVSLVKLKKYLDIDLYYLIYGKVENYEINNEFDSSGIKYLTMFEQICLKDDYLYVKQHLDQLYKETNEYGDYLLNVAVRYNSINIIKTLLMKYAADYQSDIANLFNNIRRDYGGKFDNIFDELTSIAIRNNDIPLIEEIETYSKIKHSFVGLEYDINDKYIASILDKNVEVDTYMYLAKNKIIKLDEVIKLASDLPQREALIKLVDAYYKIRKDEETIEECYIKKMYQSQYLEDIKKVSTVKANFHSYIEFVYEKALIINDNKLIDLLFTKGNKYTAIKIALLMGRIDLIKKYDDKLYWERTINYDDIDFEGFNPLHIEKSYEASYGKFEFALFSGNQEIIEYLKTVSKSEIRPEEALVFSNYKTFKTAYLKVPELKMVEDLNRYSGEELVTFTKNHLTKKSVDLSLTEETNPDLYEANKQIELKYKEGDNLSIEAFRDYLINRLQKAGVDKYCTNILTRKNTIEYFNTDHLNLGGFGLAYAILHKEEEKINFLMKYCSLQQLFIAINDTDDFVLLQEIEEEIDKRGGYKIFFKFGFDFDETDIVDLYRNTKLKSKLITKCHEMLDKTHQDYSKGQIEVITGKLGEVYDTYPMKSKKFMDFLEKAIEDKDKINDVLDHFSKLCSKDIDFNADYKEFIRPNIEYVND